MVIQQNPIYRDDEYNLQQLISHYLLDEEQEHPIPQTFRIQNFLIENHF